MTQSEGLVGSDLLAAFVARRVLPLQGRPHLICQMSGLRDLSRMCTKEMPRAEVANMVNHIANCEFGEDWHFGKEPYRAPTPSSGKSYLLIALSSWRPTPLLTLVGFF